MVEPPAPPSTEPSPWERKVAGGLAFLQRTTCNDVARLSDGQGQYTALPMDNGAAVDDAIVYRYAADRYLMVVNAGNIEKDFAWLRAQAPQGCELRDRSDEFALLALQGPRAQEILGQLTAMDLPAIKSYHFAEGEVAGVRAVVARTGYTGDLGYEIWMAADEAVRVWDALMTGGRPFDIKPAGMLALDVVRIEAGLLLIDIDFFSCRKALLNSQLYSPFEMGLGRLVDVDKRRFVGQRVLVEEQRAMFAALDDQPARTAGQDLLRGAPDVVLARGETRARRRWRSGMRPNRHSARHTSRSRCTARTATRPSTGSSATSATPARRSSTRGRPRSTS